MSRLTYYCNLTTDLEDVIQDIEKYAYQSIDNNLFESVSGQDYSMLGQVGYVGALYIDKEAQTVASSLANVDETNTWYYANNVLYIYTNAIGNTNITISSDTWENVATEARERASQELENYLYMYNSPLPYLKNSDRAFDEDIVIATSILTCRNIIRSKNPRDELVDTLNRMIYDKENEMGIIWDYTHGVKKFSFEGTRTSFNGKITPVQVSGTGTIELTGISTDLDYHKYNVKITTGGVVGTAIYQLTKDGTVLGSYTTDYGYDCIPHSGCYIRFSGTFTADDEWNIEYDGRIKQETGGIESIRMTL